LLTIVQTAVRSDLVKRHSNNVLDSRYFARLGQIENALNDLSFLVGSALVELLLYFVLLCIELTEAWQTLE
jgi:hypothetical protein